jgi:hypothetical protein
MTEAERDKKLRQALYVMLALSVGGFIAYWIIHAVFHAPSAAFAVLILGTCGGAGYYIYQTHKLKPKDLP